jgi:hypothetical protein
MPYTAQQADAFTECIKCGEPFMLGRENDKRPPLDPTGFRKMVQDALEQDNGIAALELLDTHLPPFMALLNEFSRAAASLMGECRCKDMKIIGAKPGPREPCPHVRAMRAFRRLGLPEKDIAALRQSIPLRIR